MADTRKTFHEQLDTLHTELLKMGSLVEESVFRSVDALNRMDLDLAEAVIENDRIIDDMEIKIEQDCLRLLALQQPLATDLRRIGTMLKVVTDLERMADHATSIARTTKRLKGEILIKPLVDIPKMAELSQAMLRDSLNAYIRMDQDLAYQVAKNDDEVDHIYGRIFDELIELMIKHREHTTQAMHLLFVAQALERLADHATNIAEWVIYLITGEKLELND
jgi:phosphate transport system protein